MTTFQPQTLAGSTAVDPNGDKIGKVGQVYLDDRTGEPAWVTVTTGLFGSRGSFAPLYGATVRGEDLVLTVTKDQVKDAPNVEDDAHINDEEQRALYAHYAGIYGTDSGWQGWQTGEYEQQARGQGGETSGSNTDDAMTRSEERVQVGTQSVETGRARLRKYVVTENVTQTVPVAHEELRVEREPITEGNVGAATEGPEISEAEHEVALHAERPVVAKETVPVERVRVGTETVPGEEAVDETVRKEQIEVEGDEGTTGTSGPRQRR